ncbi:MAG TPA: PPC domain-containing DNA-binding protein [Acetobacteraceae bacterium]|nr:PPC domain-containing DNA-binding protein [Acetobacteraceae bacterium]
MQAKLIHQSDGQRTFAVILDTGDEVVASLTALAARENLSAAQVTAIGAFSDAVLGYFDWQTKDYRRIPVREQVEVASFMGDIALGPDSKPSLHVHVVFGRRDGAALAGHLFEAHVRPTLEVVLTETPAHLRKRKDPESGLALIELGIDSAV